MSDTFTDRGGHERTEEQVVALIRDTLRQMTNSELIEMLMDEWPSVIGLPPDLTRCPCHDYWYDECARYAPVRR